MAKGVSHLLHLLHSVPVKYFMILEVDYSLRINKGGHVKKQRTCKTLGVIAVKQRRWHRSLRMLYYDDIKLSALLYSIRIEKNGKGILDLIL